MADHDIAIGSIVEDQPDPVRRIRLLNTENDLTMHTTITPQVSWLSASVATGSFTDVSGLEIDITVDLSDAGVGTHTGQILIASTASSCATNSPYTVEVTVTITAVAQLPTTPLIIAPKQISFKGPESYSPGAVGPIAKPTFIIPIKNVGSGTANITATLSGMEGDQNIGFPEPPGTFWNITPTTITQNDDTISITPVYDEFSYSDLHNGTLTLTDGAAGNSPFEIDLFVESSAGNPRPWASIVSATSQLYNYQINAGGSIPNEVITFNMSTVNTQVATIEVQSISDNTWVAATPTSGIDDGDTVTVSFTPGSLAVGLHISTITFTDSTFNAANTPFVVTFAVVVI